MLGEKIVKLNNMPTRKSKKDFKDRLRKIDAIYLDFFEKMKKLQHTRDRVVADFVNRADKESIKKLRKSINDTYR